MNLFGQSSGLFGTTPSGTSGFKLPAVTTASAFPSIPATTSQSFAFGNLTSTSATTPAAPTAAPSVGLGGVSVSSDSQQAETASGQKQFISPKDSLIPKEVLALVTELKEEVKSNRLVIDEIMNFDVRRLLKIEDEMETLSIDLNKALRIVYRTAKKARALREEIRYDLRQSENAQRVYESVHTTDLKILLQYLFHLVSVYENQLQRLIEECDLLENYLKSNKASSFTVEDLRLGLNKLNETFRAIASRYYEAHERVKMCRAKVSQRQRVTQGSSDAQRLNVKGPDAFQPSHGLLLSTASTLKAGGSLPVALNTLLGTNVGPGSGFGNSSGLAGTNFAMKNPSSGFSFLNPSSSYKRGKP
uniref:Nucleoporin Nup54 alpha-helical domain-containing protein n=1 Tax=Trichuris muris TaxID=70415 RepID=A0A5S6Q2Y9_TRIMR